MIPRSKNEPVSDFLLKLSKKLRKVEARGWRKLRRLSDDAMKRASEFFENCSTFADDTVDDLVEKLKDKYDVKIFFVYEDRDVSDEEIIDELFGRVDDDDDDEDDIFTKFVDDLNEKIAEAREAFSDDEIFEEKNGLADLVDVDNEDFKEWAEKVNQNPLIRIPSEVDEKINKTQIKEIFDSLNSRLADLESETLVLLIGENQKLIDELVESAKDSGNDVLTISTSVKKTSGNSTYLKDSRVAFEELLKGISDLDGTEPAIVFIDASEGSPQGLNSLLKIYFDSDKKKHVGVVVNVEDDKNVYNTIKEKAIMKQI